jgi:ubiquinone/menaquinone biosynthesis C-methylase UbiE
MYADITEVPVDTLEMVVSVLELRAGDPRQVEMREKYFSQLDLPADAKVLESGCGPGPVSRHLAAENAGWHVTGIDPSPHFISKAMERAADVTNLGFVVGDARKLPFDDASFDAVIFHTALCHIPDSASAIGEAHRVLRSGGTVVIFDGDYATTSVAVGQHDPLQCCVETMIDGNVHDKWFVRRAPKMLKAAGFDVGRADGYSYLLLDEAAYLLTIFDRGTDAQAASELIGGATAEAMKAEIRRRQESGEFFGFIHFVSIIARKNA